MIEDYSHYKVLELDKVRVACDVCGSHDLTPIITWDNFPLTEVYVEKSIELTPGIGRSDLVLDYCQACTHAQLRNILDQNALYGHNSDYAFRSSESRSAILSYEYFLDFTLKALNIDNLGKILEIGCNDMYLVNKAAYSFERYLGIDPILSKVDTDVLPDNCEVIADFFENVEIDFTPDIVICKDVVEHVINPKDFIEKLLEKGNENTTYIVQVTIMETICANRRFDQVFHQHLNYFSRYSFETLLQSLGCQLVGFDVNHFHWGVGIFAFKKGDMKVNNQLITLDKINKGISAFDNKMSMANDAIYENSQLGPVYCFGAGLMLSVYAYHIEEYNRSISCILDDSTEKQKTKCMHFPIPIVASTSVDNMHESTVVLGAVSSRANVLTMMAKAIEWQPRQIINPILVV